MKTILVIAAVLLTVAPSVATDSSELAQATTNVEGLKRLADSAFGGGSFEKVEGSPFYVVDLQQTSGLVSTEIFIFAGSDDDLRLKAHLPLAVSVSRKAEWTDGKLVVKELRHDENEWKTILELFQ